MGSYFYQTDGPTLPPSSVLSDAFLHVNDDAVKAYHSDQTVERVVVWKGHNDPVIQLGWVVRDLKSIRIDQLHLIHSRYRRDEMVVPSALIGASPFYNSTGQHVDPTKAIRLNVTNVVCEGPSASLMRITPLQSYLDVHIDNLSFPDGLQPIAGESRVPAAPVPISMGLHITNWTVSGQLVTMHNFQAIGRLNIDLSYWGQWGIR